MPDPLSVGWRLPSGLRLVFRTVGESLAVFNEEAEDTHLLDPFAGRLVERLASGEVLVGEELAEVAAALEQGGFEAQQVLRELQVLGLAEPFTP